MKNYERDSKREEKNKKRGLLTTLFFHITCICLAFFPLMGSIQNVDLVENIVEFVEMDDITFQDHDVKFVNNVEDEKRNGESNEDSKSTEDTETPEPNPAPQEEPDPKPVDVVDDIDAPNITSGDNDKGEVQPNETPKVTPTPDPKPTPSKPSGNKPADDNKPGGNSNNPGLSGDGGDDDSLQEGVFGRKVMKRPNIKGLTKKKGRIAIKVCVSQEGTVIASKYLSQFSTISESKLIAAAMKAARRYKFDVDYTAPKKQWGKLTFVFDL